MTTIPASPDGFCTSNFEWCAVPYGNEKFIIIHQGAQVRVCRTLRTALSFIQDKENYVCEPNRKCSASKKSSRGNRNS